MVTSCLSGFLSAASKAPGLHSVLYDLVEKFYDTLSQNVSSLDGILENLGIEKFGVIHAAVLRIKLSHTVTDKDTLLLQVENFLKLCPVECMKYMPVYLHCISQDYTNFLINNGCPSRGILPMITCIRNITGSQPHLTALHAQLLQLAIASKIFAPVLPILDIDILEIDRATSALDAKDYLLYFYYGGMIYAALKNWERSLHLFELCLVIPAISLSCILIEAAKKIILISLIHAGKFTAIPDVPVTYFMSPRPWKYYCQTYLELASLFRTASPEELSSFVTRNRHVFTADHNYGLTKQVLKYHVNFRIHSLTKEKRPIMITRNRNKIFSPLNVPVVRVEVHLNAYFGKRYTPNQTFITMSLADVANRVKLSGSQEAESHILEMIKSKNIFAKIDQRDGTVHFLDDPEHYDSVEMLQFLHKKIDQCINLEKHLMHVSDQIVKNPSYIKRMIELENKSSKSSGPY